MAEIVVWVGKRALADLSRAGVVGRVAAVCLRGSLQRQHRALGSRLRALPRTLGSPAAHILALLLRLFPLPLPLLPIPFGLG
eukprot:scaffold91409_cov18-Prasinocladus_malaysianus.AAC.1